MHGKTSIILYLKWFKYRLKAQKFQELLPLQGVWDKT